MDLVYMGTHYDSGDSVIIYATRKPLKGKKRVRNANGVMSVMKDVTFYNGKGGHVYFTHKRKRVYLKDLKPV